MKQWPLISISIFIAVGLLGFSNISQANAAISFVQSTSSSAYANSTSATFPSNTTAGNLIVVAAGLYGNSFVTSTISDTAGDTFTVIASSTSPSSGCRSNCSTYLWYAKNIKGGADTVTVDWGQEDVIFESIHEYSGLDTANPFDQQNASDTNPTGSSINTGSTTITSANELLFSFVFDYPNGYPSSTWTVSPGWTKRETINNGGGFSGMQTADEIVSTIGTYSNTFGGAASGDTLEARIATFEAAPDLTPPSVTLLSPPSGSVVSSTVTLSASSTDNVAVAGVQFQIDGVDLGLEVTATSSPSIYSSTWNTASSSDGTHVITAISYDTSNNTSTATSSVIVHNASLSVTTSTSLSFSGTSGGSPPASQAITIKNSGTPSSTLSFSLASNESWLTLSTTSGSLPGNATTSISLTANPASLSAGTYDATATIEDTVVTSSLVSFPVIFTVAAAQSSPPSAVTIIGVPASYGTPDYNLVQDNAGPTSTDNASPTAASPLSTASLEAEIASLQAELQSLLAEAPKPSFEFTRNLSFGETGSDVQALQAFLIQQDAGPNAEKLKAHGTTQYFGILTFNALREYQASVGLPATGYFGEMTRGEISPKL